MGAIREDSGGGCHTEGVEFQEVSATTADGGTRLEVVEHCGWCGDELAVGINHSLCVEPLQILAERLDDRAAWVEERAEVARESAGRVLRVA